MLEIKMFQLKEKGKHFADHLNKLYLKLDGPGNG